MPAPTVTCPECRHSFPVPPGRTNRVNCPICETAVAVPVAADPRPPLPAPTPRPALAVIPADAVTSMTPRGPTAGRIALVGGVALFLTVSAGLGVIIVLESEQTASKPPTAAEVVARGSQADPMPHDVGMPYDPFAPVLRGPEVEPQPEPDPKTPPPTPLVDVKDPECATGPHAQRVSSRGKLIVVTDRLTGKEVWRQNAAEKILSVAFAPDGKSVVSRDQKGETCTWNASNGELEKREAPAETVVVDMPPPKPEDPKPVDPKQPLLASLTPDQLRGSLLKTREVDFYPAIDKLREEAITATLPGKDFTQDQTLRQQYLVTSPPKFLNSVNGVLLKKAAEEGLPLVPKEYIRMSPQAAQTMDSMSKELRRLGFVSVPGGPSPFIAATGTETSAQATDLQGWCKQNHIERYPGALNTFLQMLQVEDDATRTVLVDELGKCDNPVATRVLVTRAVFDLSPEVRKAAVELLRKRQPNTYRPQLVYTMRYPWAPAADHAAEALIALNDKKAIPELVALLDKPDPLLPVVDDRHKDGVVHELVRINHMRNCFLCHAVSPLQNELVRGAVPRPGQPLPRMYYNAAQADFVQATITYLRQDFSVAQPVENASPWPEMQRYDYLVRTRKATEDELTALREDPKRDYAQRNSALAALVQLSGRDLGTTTEAWKKYAEDLAAGKETTDRPDPKDKPRTTEPSKR